MKPTVHDLYAHLSQLLGLPKGTQRFQLRGEVNKWPVVICEYLPTIPETQEPMDTVLTVIFTLVPKGEQER